MRLLLNLAERKGVGRVKNTWRELMERPVSTTGQMIVTIAGFAGVILAIVLSTAEATSRVLSTMNDQANRLVLLERQDNVNTLTLETVVFNLNVWQDIWRIQIQNSLPRNRAARDQIEEELKKLKKLQPPQRYREDVANGVMKRKE
jgi:hypothetical protein